MINEKKKWQFCPEKRCYRCKRDLTEKLKDIDEVVTGCFYCNRSFVE